MRVLICIALISYGFGVVSNYNMQMQAKIVLKKDFLKDYLRNSKPTSVHFDIEVPPGLGSALGYELGKSELRSRAEKEEKTEGRMWSRDLDTVPQLVDYLIQNSYPRFHSTITSFVNKLMKDQGETSINPDINSSISNYKTKLQERVDHLSKYNPDNQVEKDIILLDIVQTSNRLIYEETFKCLQNVTLSYDSLMLTTNIEDLAKELFSSNLRKKKEEFQYLCQVMNLCRPFPGFSDYLADFLGELSKLSESNMHTIIMKTVLIVSKKQSDVIRILGNHLVNKIDEQLQKIIFDDLSAVRKALSSNRKAIFERYKAKRISDRTKAFRLLLDMVDKAFEIDGAEEIVKHFNIITDALRSWVAGQIIDVEEIEKFFLDYITDTLNEKWTNETEKEVRTLVHIALDEKPGNRHYKYLLVNGSNFVNNIDNVTINT